MNELLKIVEKTILSQSLIRGGEKILVALSGGADSVCLLHVLSELSSSFQIALGAAHLNHGLRGEESDMDEAFVKDLCNRLCVPLFLYRADVKGISEKEKIGLEAAGRKARYGFFDSVMNEKGFDLVATAHQRDDSAETILMYFLRGAGLSGLSGIPYRNNRVIRPLLDVSAASIRSYLEEKNIPYRVDSTNYQEIYTRNKVRQSLIPMLEREFNPGLRNSLYDHGRFFSICEDFCRQEADQRFLKLAKPYDGGFLFSQKGLLEEHPFMLMSVLHLALKQLLKSRELSQTHVDGVMALLNGNSGQLFLPEGVTAELCHGSLYLLPPQKDVFFSYDMPLSGQVIIPETGVVISVTEIEERPFSPGKNCVYLNPEKLLGKQLQVRSRRNGDSFVPAGMKGHKKLQDFLTDEKIPRFMRDAIPIVTADEEIIWVAGHRADDRYLCKDAKGKQICIRLSKGDFTC